MRNSKDFNRATNLCTVKEGRSETCLVFGFPGVGKTTYVKMKKASPRVGTVGAVDFDVKGPDCWKGMNSPVFVRSAAASLVNSWLLCGADVLTHPWAVDPDRWYPGRILIVKPDSNFRLQWTHRIQNRGDKDFATKVFNNWWQWLDDMVEFAVRLQMAGNSVKTIYMTPEQYLSDILIGELGG